MQKLFNTPLDQLIKRFTLRDFFILLILLLAVLSRFIGLGDRVMSHDEVNHVVPAYDLFAGRGYRHDPITHGPLQFHLMGLSYFMFGDNDFTSRLPHAIFSILTIAFVMVAFRRYLGSFGSIIAGILFTISPFMLFYGRYARNDAICVFLGVVAIYSFLRYFETRNNKYVLFLTISLALNFTAKETAYIFSAQLLLFVLLLFALNIIKVTISDRKKTTRIISANILLVLLVILLMSASVLLFRQAYVNNQQSATTTMPVVTDVNSGFAGFFESALPVLSFILPGIIPLIMLTIPRFFSINTNRHPCFAAFVPIPGPFCRDESIRLFGTFGHNHKLYLYYCSILCLLYSG